MKSIRHLTTRLAAIATLLTAGLAWSQNLPGNATPAMPPGHPPLDQLMGMGLDPAAVPTSRPMVLGSLTLQVTTGTAGAPSIANESVTVELYHRGTALQKFVTKLDDKGTVTLNDLPIMPPVQALITIQHAGLEQQIVSPELSPAAPQQTLQMKVYETTQEKPAWTVAMQHMIVQWMEDGSGIRVTEMLSTSNPADRAWVGSSSSASTAPATTAGQPVTLTIPIAADAQNIELGDGFDEHKTNFIDGKLVTSSPLFPGRSEFRVNYTVPASKGALTLNLTTPAQVGNLYVFLPGDGAKVTATGLAGGDVVDTGQGAVRMYKAENLAAGQSVSLNFTGIGAAAEPVTQSAFSAKNIALGGAFLLVLAGAGMMMIRKPHAKHLRKA